MITLVTMDDMDMGQAWEFESFGIDYRIEHSPTTVSLALFYRHGDSWIHRFTRNIEAYTSMTEALREMTRTVVGK
jgi:hypothetical protein